MDNVLIYGNGKSRLDFKPRKFMVKPTKKVKKNKVSNKTKKKKKAIDQEW